MGKRRGNVGCQRASLIVGLRDSQRHKKFTSRLLPQRIQVAMRIVYVTGIPRSGSTWAFNIARLTMCELHGVVPHYGDRQAIRGIPSDVTRAVVKVHEVVPRPDGSLVIHSTRNYAEAYDSWMKLNPNCTGSPEYLQHLDMRWRPSANLMFHHSMLSDRQSRLCVAWSISRLIGLESYQKAVEISKEVDALRIPGKRIDPVTFLQPRHRG